MLRALVWAPPLWLAEFRPTLSDASNMEDMGALQRHQLFSAVIHDLLANAALRQITVFWLINMA